MTTAKSIHWPLRPLLDGVVSRVMPWVVTRSVPGRLATAAGSRVSALVRIVGIGYDREESAMASAKDVAKFFLTLSEPDEGDLISNLKLQKLCYYAQGFHLAMHGKLLFPERIEAWEHGPVVPPLYHEYKQHGSGGIPVPVDFDVSSVTKEEQELLTDVWNAYGQFSAWKLRNMTHEEAPWANTPLGQVIPPQVLREFFTTLLK